ncbi:MAG: cobalt-precorrin-4/precorrin-4 C(11)-methyltransferase, partial [Desulfovibrio sp.]|nr:cobalt-precorrin-4/precorrin-4 C(11)-methyltransferase [Desulfovibrio sp.]
MCIPPPVAPGLVSFVGAGPGDPELLTIKGRKAIAEAALVLYTGSLVPAAVVACASPNAVIQDSAPLTLEQCHVLMREASLAGKLVARVHTGDPSLYGCLQEQTKLLDADGIPWRVIPGVTAACAAAAAAGLSFTIPEAAQSLIITRMKGETPVPDNEKLPALAAHKTSMAIYLSANRAEEVQKSLLRSLPAETPILCAHRVGWPDE